MQQEFQSVGVGEGGSGGEAVKEKSVEEGGEEDVWSEDWWSPQEVAGERPQLRRVAAKPVSTQYPEGQHFHTPR